MTFVSTRERFERDHPAGAALAPGAAGALAVPLRSGGSVVGAMGFPFLHPDTIDDEVVALARLAADLGGQALERAGLYDQERQSREGLDRILRLAPLFDSESPEAVVEMVCKEAISTFGSDIAQVWANADGGMFDVVWREPPSDVIPPGTRVEAADFPGLTESMRRLETMFIPDSWMNVRGTALAHARHFGIRSSLRVPIAVGGRAERVLALQWRRVLPEPSPSTIILARRFADQAGIALEHAERRVAQTAASRNAEETRRLLDVTASLAAALEPSAVATAILQEAFKGLDARAGVVVRLNGERELAVVEAVGYPAHDLAGWETFGVDADVPLADAVRRNEIVALESPAERTRRYPALSRVEGRHAAWLSVPLVAGGRVVGGLGLSFSSTRSFSDGDREFALALSRQAGQALDRSSLLETEHAARMRAERMASDLAQLHALATSLSRAGAATDVTQIVGEQMIHGVGAGSAGVYTFLTSRTELSLLDVTGRLGRGDLAAAERVPVDDPGPIALAVRRGGPVWIVEDVEWEAFPQAAPWREGRSERPRRRAARRRPGGDRRPVRPVRRGAAPVAGGSALRGDRRPAGSTAARAKSPLRRGTGHASSCGSPPGADDVALRRAHPRRGRRPLPPPGLGRSRRSRRRDGHPGRGGEAAGGGRMEGRRRARTSRDGSTPRRSGEHRCARLSRADARLYFSDAAALLEAYPEARDLVGHDEQRAFAFVPVVVGRRVFAVTVLAWDKPVPLATDDRLFIETVASQCGQALDRAQRYEAERTIAETLQRSVLPETLPAMEGATVAARYLPGTAAMDVGGDWFDTIPLADGRLGFVVGDVVGKGVQAASTMAQLRNGMRALTLDSSDPGTIVTKLNRLLDGYTDAPFATLAFVTVDPLTYDATLISAGHLPPLVLAPGGEPHMLEGSRGLPLGVDPDTRYEPWSTTLEPGSVIVLYTDGLVERRDRSLDEGLRLLVEAARDASFDPEQIVDLLIDRLIGGDDRGDDVAVLAVALDRAPLGSFAVRLPADRESLVAASDGVRTLARAGWDRRERQARSHPRDLGSQRERRRARSGSDRAVDRGRGDARGRQGAGRGLRHGDLAGAARAARAWTGPASDPVPDDDPGRRAGRPGNAHRDGARTLARASRGRRRHMQLTIERHDGHQFVRVSGELDTFAAQSFKERLGQLVTVERCVVDLGGLSFVDSAGLHALFGVCRVAKEVGASLVFVVPADSPVRRVIDLVQLADVASVCDTLELAISQLSTVPGRGLRDKGAG